MNHTDFSDPLTFPLAHSFTAIEWITMKFGTIIHVSITVNRDHSFL